MIFLANVVNTVIRLFTLVVLVDVVLMYFMDPYHPVRRTLDRIVNPFLAPVRRIIPPMGGIDFSPLVLIIVLQILGSIINRLLISISL